MTTTTWRKICSYCCARQNSSLLKPRPSSFLPSYHCTIVRRKRRNLDLLLIFQPITFKRRRKDLMSLFNNRVYFSLRKTTLRYVIIQWFLKVWISSYDRRYKGKNLDGLGFSYFVFCLGSLQYILLFRRILDIQSRRHYLFFMIQSFTENRAFSFSRLAVFKTPYPVV